MRLHLAILLSLVAGCDETNVRRPGTSGRGVQPDATASGESDAGFAEDLGPGVDRGPIPDLGPLPDFGPRPDFGLPPPHDAGFGPDAFARDEGFSIDFGFRDAEVPDFGFPPPRDAGFGDGGVRMDGGDAGSGPVSVSVMGTSVLELDLRPGAMDGLNYSATFVYDNATAAPIAVRATSASVALLTTVTQQFAIAPDHVATPGRSLASVAKVPGSGSPPFMPDPLIRTFICTLPLPMLVDVQFSTGASLTDTVAVTCIQ